MSTKYDPFIAQKAALWEEAKGKLRAMIAVDGSKIDGDRDEEGRYSHMIIEEIVEAFIKEIEDDEHHM